jgi:5-methyltetrahydropteroyltriglutamate--homocysteine methyltransferase
LLLEYDDERSGSFEPLKEVPDDKIVVLGLVTTKSPRRETVAELSARLKSAGRYIALERLALCPQCGFSTSIVGNRITPEDQKCKLQVIVETAKQVWG